jgi:hypothetical protein
MRHIIQSTLRHESILRVLALRLIRQIRAINFVDFSTARHSSNEFGSVQALNEKFVVNKISVISAISAGLKKLFGNSF